MRSLSLSPAAEPVPVPGFGFFQGCVAVSGCRAETRHDSAVSASVSCSGASTEPGASRGLSANSSGQDPLTLLLPPTRGWQHQHPSTATTAPGLCHLRLSQLPGTFLALGDIPSPKGSWATSPAVPSTTLSCPRAGISPGGTPGSQQRASPQQGCSCHILHLRSTSFRN